MSWHIVLKDTKRSIRITDSMLDQVEDMGKNHFSWQDMATVMEADEEWMKERILHHPNHPFYQRYHKGRLLTEMKLRKQIFDMADRGSAQAQEMAAKFVLDNRMTLV